MKITVNGSDFYPGIYKAIVVDNNDVQKRNRLKIRIPSIHGLSMDDSSLPWALPCSFYTSDPQLPIGAVVWVMFEGGYVGKPVYMGYLLKFDRSDIS